jgi:hypothetical protein
MRRRHKALWPLSDDGPITTKVSVVYEQAVKRSARKKRIQQYIQLTRDAEKGWDD